MPRINNEGIYKPDQLISDKDTLLGNDNDNNGKTAVFSVGGISTRIIKSLIPETGISGNKLLKYGFYNEPDTYTYYAWTYDYIINNIRYQEYISATLVLEESHNTYDRVDIIVVNDNGTIVAITGTPAENPTPPAIDYNSQVLMTFIIVEANTTSPSNVVTTRVYDENLQVAGGEFDTSETGLIDLENTNEFQSGTKSIFFAGSGTAQFTNDVLIGQSKLFNIIFKIKLANTEAHRIIVYVGNVFPSEGSDYDAARLTDVISIENGRFGFDGNNTSDWQTIIIPFDAFKNSLPFDKIWITNSVSSSNFYIDNIIVQDGIAITSNSKITKTSELLNDGPDAINPFITAKDLEGLASLEVIIDGAFVIAAGKTNLTIWELEDKFRMWIGDRYVVGKIASVPVSLPADIDTNKVKLAQSSEI